MASSATIPMAQSVTIPNHVVQISPTSSAPQITEIKDNGYLWRAYPSDTLQGKVLAQAAVATFGKGATLNVGARNDAFGTALKQLFVAQYKKLGGKVGVNISWNPNQPNFDTEAQPARRRQPEGLGDHRLPGDVPEVRPVARPHRQVGRGEDVHDRGAAQHDRRSTRSAARSSGSAAPPRARPAGRPACVSPRSGRRT